MTPKPTILVVEDESHIAELVVFNLELEGYQVLHADSIKQMHIYTTQHDIDLILLDVMLPDGNGIDACISLKNKYPKLSILVLSALGQSADKVRGLKAGADDYLSKPFNLEELLLRVDILLKRSNIDTRRNTQFSIGDAEIDLKLMQISHRGRITNLTANECEFISYMYSHPNQALSRQQIISHVWGADQSINYRTIDNIISMLRKAIEPDSKQVQYIKTVRGVGYMLLLDAQLL